MSLVIVAACRDDNIIILPKPNADNILVVLNTFYMFIDQIKKVEQF